MSLDDWYCNVIDLGQPFANKRGMFTHNFLFSVTYYSVILSKAYYPEALVFGLAAIYVLLIMRLTLIFNNSA